MTATRVTPAARVTRRSPERRSRLHGRSPYRPGQTTRALISRGGKSVDVLWTQRSEGLLRGNHRRADGSCALLVLCEDDADLARELTAVLEREAPGLTVVTTSAEIHELLRVAAECMPVVDA